MLTTLGCSDLVEGLGLGGFIGGVIVCVCVCVCGGVCSNGA